jgi:GNAT superfamily N-acetyltransferase
MVLRRAELLPLVDQPAMHVEQLWVDPEARQRGIAKALLRFVAVAAQRHGAAEVVCSVPAGRDANRFLARLGFAPMVVLRAASVPTVLRRCQAEEETSPGRDRTLARRRLQRVHRQTGALV